MSLDHHIPYLGISTSAAMKGFAGFGALLAFLVSAGCGAGSTSTVNNPTNKPVAASVSATITVGTAPVSIAVDSTGNKIYVGNYGTAQTRSGRCQTTGSDITQIDGATGSTSTITPGQSASNTLAVVANPANQAVYAVVQTYFENLANCATANAALEAVSGAQPSANFCANCQFGGIAVNPQTGTIYLGNYHYYLFGRLVNSYVSVFNSTSTWGTQVDISLTPVVSVGMAANPATNKIYVADAPGINVIDGVTNSLSLLVANVSAGGASAIDVNPTTNQIYVADGHSKVTVIDGATGSITATIAVGTSPTAVAVDSQTNFIYVANAGNALAGNPGNITVINGATKITQTLTDPNAKNPVAVALNPTTNRIYVANLGTNNVTVIDGARD